MHEISIAQEIINLVGNYIPDSNFEVSKNNYIIDKNKIKLIRVDIGIFSGILPESLKFGFEVLSSGTYLQNTELEINSIPLILKCHNCNKTSELTEPMFYCQYCESSKVEILSGLDMRVTEIEIEE